MVQSGGEPSEERLPAADGFLDSISHASSSDAPVISDSAMKAEVRDRTYELIINRPNGRNTERPVFDLDGLRERDTLSPEDIAQYSHQDRKEFEKVAAEMTRVLGENISADKAVKMASQRMTDLMLCAVRAMASHDKMYVDEIWKRIHVQRGKPVNPNSLFFRLFGDSASLQEVDGQYYTYSGWLYQWRHRGRLAMLDAEIKELKRKMDQGPTSFHSGRTYEVHPTTELRTQTHSARDVVLIYEDSGQRRLLRLNLIQCELARRGIFYKGGPADNSFSRTNTRGDQAAYPTSPLQFFHDHMLPALLEDDPPKIHHDEEHEDRRERQSNE